ncbi:MAG TPA: YfiR family protein [Patescibacteria group bacterium]|nr:YfiR family protein [Patescibacteria group bacterium]
MRLGRAIIAIVALAALACGAGKSRAESVDSKYTLISAYIYNFTQLTTWPSSAMDDAFKVCVVGQDPFGANLNPLKTRKVNDRKITVHHLGPTDSELASCNALYVSGSETGNLKSILGAIRGTPVLTMSDISGFSNQGGMVEFKLEEGKIGIWVALSAVRVTGLSISSKLLSLANMNIR